MTEKDAIITHYGGEYNDDRRKRFDKKKKTVTVRAPSREGGVLTIYLQRLIEIHHGHNEIGHDVIFVFREHGQLGDHLREPVVRRGHVQPVSDVQEVLCDRQT